MKILIKGQKGPPGSRTAIFQVLPAPELLFSRFCLLSLDGRYSGIYGAIIFKFFMCAPLTLGFDRQDQGQSHRRYWGRVQGYPGGADEKGLCQVQEPPGAGFGS